MDGSGPAGKRHGISGNHERMVDEVVEILYSHDDHPMGNVEREEEFHDWEFAALDCTIEIGMGGLVEDGGLDAVAKRRCDGRPDQPAFLGIAASADQLTVEFAR